MDQKKKKTKTWIKSFPTNQIAKFNNRQLYYLIFILDLGNLLFSTLFSKLSKGWKNIRVFMESSMNLRSVLSLAKKRSF